MRKKLLTLLYKIKIWNLNFLLYCYDNILDNVSLKEDILTAKLDKYVDKISIRNKSLKLVKMELEKLEQE